MMLANYGVSEENWRDGAAVNAHFAAISESPRFVGRAVAALAADPQLQRRNGGSFSSGGLAREYGFTDLDGSQPDCWRYMVEVQDAGCLQTRRATAEGSASSVSNRPPPRGRPGRAVQGPASRSWRVHQASCSSVVCRDFETSALELRSCRSEWSGLNHPAQAQAGPPPSPSVRPMPAHVGASQEAILDRWRAPA